MYGWLLGSLLQLEHAFITLLNCLDAVIVNMIVSSVVDHVLELKFGRSCALVQDS